MLRFVLRGVPVLLVMLFLLALPGLGRAGAQAQVDARQTLADRHRPVVYLRGDRVACKGEGEAFAPYPVEMMLGRDRVILTDGESSQRGPVAADLWRKGWPYALNLPGNPRIESCTFERQFAETSTGLSPAVYAHFATEGDHDGFAIQYWFFYYFNDWNNRHEGDWEMIQVTFDDASPEEALAKGSSPSSIAYTQHAGGESHEWGERGVGKEGERPIVYVAQGSHANQFEPDIYLGLGEGGAGLGCDDARPPGRRVDPAAIVLPGGDPGQEAALAWITYEGRWGEPIGAHFDGPTGPNKKFSYSHPFSWEAGLRSGSLPIPGDTLLGENYVTAVCSILRSSSMVMGLYYEWPLIVNGGMIALVAAIGVSGAMVAKDAVLARGVLGRSLVRRWRMGLIIRGSLALYRSNWRTFLGIGAVYVPVGMALLLIQELVKRFTPAGTVTGLIEENRGFDLFISLSYGGAQTGAAFFFVLAASLYALREIDAGRRPTARASLRAALLAVPRLVASVGRAVLVIAGLFVTVVGIPAAIRQAVRWYFVEHTVVFEGMGPVSAAGRSSNLVQGRWLKTAFRVAIIASVSILGVPILLALSLYYTPVPIAFANYAGVVLHSALLPLIAIAHALVYFDLRFAEVERGGLREG